MRKLAFVLLFALAASAQQPQPVTRKYVMIMGANHAFYVGMYSPPEEVGLLARALMAHGGRMKLLPAGEASLTKAETVTLDDKTKVTRYEIAGLGFTPYSVWLDANNEYFGNIDSWAS